MQSLAEGNNHENVQDRKGNMRILIIALSDLKNDPRVFHQISWLSQSHEVTCMGYKDPGIRNVRFIHIKQPQRTMVERVSLIVHILFHRYDTFLHKKFRNLYSMEQGILSEQFDIIIANDIDTLPFALTIKKSAKVVFDAHEYYPKEFEDLWAWRFLYQNYRIYQCRYYLQKANAMITVCEGIADEYYKNYSVRPEIITNAADYVDCLVSQPIPGKIKIIHHGGINASRKIENMIEMMDYVDSRFTLDLMLVYSGSSREYISHIKKMVESRSNVHLRDPVDMKEIVSTINQYDIGLYILEPNSFNNRYALPNKFFEFIQARLAIAIGPSIEMAKIVKKYDLGIIADNYSPRSMAEKLNAQTTKKIAYYKIRSHKTAKKLSSDYNRKKFEGLIHELGPAD